ncbi:MAG TPA: diguanylate cyclase, partial [Acidimicrobiia bacterium]|nr:diguanylate cyclase [Acidimicrobiia bacterium]
MAGAPRHPSSVAPAAPLDVRDPEIVVALSEAVAILDADLRPRMVLGPLGLRAGFARADDLTTRLADWIHPDDHQAVGDALERCRSAPDVDVEVRVRVHNDLDGWHTMRLGFRNLYDHPEVQGVLVRAVDETVFEREARWRSLVGESPTGIFELDTRDRCTFVNPAFARLTGRTNETALGAGWSDVFDDDDLAVMRERLRRAADTDVPCSAELRVVGDDGAVVRWVSARAVPLRDAEGRVTGFLGTLEDVTDRKRLEERLEYDATHDRLTGLGSRALLVEELQAGLARTRRGGGCVALLFIDLDGFKRVNDTLGHAAGDQLLVNVAQRLRGSVRGGDVCVRLGGDEFVVCCSNLDRAEQAIALAERMLATLSEPYDVHGHEVLVGASIGIASAHGEDPVSADQLLSNADIAAYRAKRLGRGRIEVFDDDLRRQLGKARRIGRTVSRLLDQPLVPLICTPIAHLERGAIIGFDATVDWEAAGVHEPEDAIAQVIEEAGMSRTLDLSVVRTLLAQLTEWTRRPPAPIVPGLSATLTASGALSPLVPELVRDMLARTRVAP